MQHVCKCGKRFNRTGRQIYCSPACAKIAEAAQAAERYAKHYRDSAVRLCRQCGDAFANPAGKRASLFCSEACREKRKAVTIAVGAAKHGVGGWRSLYTFECAQCESMFETSSAKGRFCSSKCRRDFHYRASRPEFTCVICYGPIPVGPLRRTCSESCAHQYKAIWVATYGQKHRCQLNENRRIRFERDPAARERQRISAREWRERNRESERVRLRAWRKANPEKLKRVQDRWRNENPEALKALKALERERYKTACAVANEFLPGEFTNYKIHGPAALQFCKRFNINPSELAS